MPRQGGGIPQYIAQAQAALDYADDLEHETHAQIKAVSCGTGHTVALDSCGGLWAWGAGKFGQIGNFLTSNQHSPAIHDEGPLSRDAVAVACGATHTVAAYAAAGQVMSWGSNHAGQLGHSSRQQWYQYEDAAAVVGGVSHPREITVACAEGALQIPHRCEEEKMACTLCRERMAAEATERGDAA